MGVLLANQNFVAIKHIIEFKENLRVLLLAGLFIILSARLQISDFQALGLKSAVFLAGLIVIVRPAAVFVSTLGSEISWRERIFMAFVAPRGIVAASVASVFALQLAEAGFPGANAIASVTFLVIIGTVIVYGLGASTLARLLNLAQPSPQGMFIVGAYPWSIALANSIKEAGYKVIVADTNWGNINAARMAGLQAYYGSALSENILQELDLEGVGRILALTPNYGVNSLAVLRFNEVFDRSELYQLHPGRKREKEPVSKHLHGRFLFTPEMTFEEISGRFGKGASIKRTHITGQFDYASFKEKYSTAIPLFLITEKGELRVLAADEKYPEPAPGQSIISLVGPE
jgi:hypothetical protein